MTTKEILIGARDLLAKSWARGSLETQGGSVCAIGALSLAQGHRMARYDDDHGLGKSQFSRAIRAVSAVLPDSTPGERPQDRVVNYNDAGNRECVVAAFDAAIERMAKGGAKR
jgi:hypothetical protein